MAVVVLVVALTAFSALRGPAPAALISASPPDGVTLLRAPTEVELSFTGPLDPRQSHVSVRDGAGMSLNVGRPGLVVSNRIRQRVSVADAKDVTVVYHVTFVDGAQLAGTLRFTVATEGRATSRAGVGPSGAGPGTDATESGPAHQHGIDPLSAVLLALDGAVVLAVLVLILRPPRHRRPAR